MPKPKTVYVGTLVLFGITAVAFLFMAFASRKQYEKTLLAEVFPTVDLPRLPRKSSAAKTLLLLGDSRVSQWPEFQIDGWSILNGGVGGITSARMALSCEELIKSTRPTLVVLQIGINDFKLLGMRPDLCEIVLQRYLTNVFHIAERCQNVGARLIVTTIWPTGPVSLTRRLVWSPSVEEVITQANAQLEKMFSQEKCVLVTNIFPSPAKISEKRPHAIYRDTLHLDPAVYIHLTSVVSNLVTAEWLKAAQNRPNANIQRQ